ncbi:MAG: hypothetical protein SW019_04295 [Actinomycetota bacterium]|nr:hypothetical protein [Actinomycetota bacterium]
MATPAGERARFDGARAVRRHAAAVAAAAALGCGACASPGTTAGQGSPDSAPVPLVSRTAEQLVADLRAEGLQVDHPVEATDTRCAEAGCTQAVVTDRFRLLTFPTTGAAQIYAAPRGMRQVETIAVGFAPVVPAAERDRYWSAIVQLAR